MSVTFDQIHCVLTLLTFSYITTPQILIKISIFCLKKLKKIRRLRAQISEMRVFVNHTFNVLGEFSMCQTLTSISTYYLTISAHFFSERYLHNVYDIISDNFRSG